MDNTARIHFERAGGVTGICLSYTFIAGSLDREDADQLHRLLYISETFRSKAGDTERGGNEDLFRYRITVETITGSEEFVFEETDIPSEAWPVIRYLTKMAMSR